VVLVGVSGGGCGGAVDLYISFMVCGGGGGGDPVPVVSWSQSPGGGDLGVVVVVGEVVPGEVPWDSRSSSRSVFLTLLAGGTGRISGGGGCAVVLVVVDVCGGVAGLGR
jgi:hypothetical protein